MSVKVLPVTPLLNGVFVHRVFCAYFVKFEGGGVMRRFLSWTQELTNLQWCRKSLKSKWRFGGSLKKIYVHGAQEWNVHWINKTGGEK